MFRLTLFERISYLAKKHDKSLKEVAEDLGLSRNAIYQWKTSSPKAETLDKVADYFNTTTDYLLGRTNSPDPSSNNSNTSNDKFAQFFKMKTDGFSEDEIETLKEEWLDYLEIRTRRMEKRNSSKSDQ